MANEDNKDKNVEHQERTKRQIVAAITVCISLILLLVIPCFFIYYMANQQAWKESIPPIAILIAIVAFIITVASCIITAMGFLFANDNIFPFSGNSVEMARTMYRSLFLQGQVLLAVLTVGVVAVLLATKIITPSEGLPIITGAVGFALGKEFGGQQIKEQEKGK